MIARRTLYILLVVIIAVVGVGCPVVRAADPTSRPSTLFREGSDIVARTGHLQKSGDSPYDRFIFDNPPDVAPLAPMRVLPNLQLLSMQTASAAARRDVRFTVWGTVTEYKGENYILLTNGPEDIERLLPALPTPQASAAPAGPTTKPSADQDALAALNSMNPPPAPADTAPSASSLPPAPSGGIDQTSTSAVAPGAPAVPVRREGSLVIDRLCRMILSPDGLHEELVFDADGAAMQDPPCIILPNLKLTAMENAAAAAVREARFRVTGFVTEYRGRNFILLQKVVVAPDANLQF